MSVITKSSYRRTSYRAGGRYSRRKSQPNFALIVIAFCLTAFVWGNYQITEPPSCGSEISIGFMNIEAGKPSVRPCEPGEVPVQKSLSDSLKDRLESVLPKA